ncbi:helix-turn-helix domain-containing protein, partial [Tolypothrix sp. VBCCA 56010]|uniref:helix-turn-helix domain-containing protein n=1 Tax=Tolypothrix sp. VBCCA 56010 TaxID=3137731 RepID=UPI003D7DEE32
MFAIKRRLKLNKHEQSLMAQHAGFSRLVYNYGLDLFWQSVDAGLKTTDNKRIQAIKKCLTNVTKKRDQFAWMNQMSSKVYQSAFQSLQTAFSRWRKGITRPPTRKTRKNKQSFTV